MQYKNTVEAIYISLAEVQELISKVGVEQEIRIIDIDLAQDKIRHIYDLLNHLKSEVSNHEVYQVKESKNIPSLEIEKEEENVIEFDLKDVDTHIDHPENKEVLSEEKIATPEKEPIKTQAEIDSRVKKHSGKKFLGDTFEKKTSSLNEELSKTINPANLTEKLTSKPILNIGSALGLNEKFEIINNLFDGEKDRYEHTLQVLNAASDFNEAYEYIAHDLQWDMENQYVQKILELIRRKLIVKKNGQ